ncbi:hypothetical protein V6Z12_A09G092000 [Gossypium hirsutum]
MRGPPGGGRVAHGHTPNDAVSALETQRKPPPHFHLFSTRVICPSSLPSDRRTTTVSGGRRCVKIGPFLAPVWSTLEGHDTNTCRCRREETLSPLLSSTSATEKSSPMMRSRGVRGVGEWWLAREEARRRAWWPRLRG